MKRGKDGIWRTVGGIAVSAAQQAELDRQHEPSYDDAQVRIQELLDANNRFEQRGRMAERFARLLERGILAGSILPTTRDMAIILLQEYRKDNPK